MKRKVHKEPSPEVFLDLGALTLMTYSEKLKDPRWQRKRLEVLNRDGWKCRDCGSQNKELQVHHHFYESGDPWETNELFLSSVCSHCHKTRGDLEKRIKKNIAMFTVCMNPSELRDFYVNIRKVYPKKIMGKHTLKITAKRIK